MSPICPLEFPFSPPESFLRRRSELGVRSPDRRRYVGAAAAEERTAKSGANERQESASEETTEPPTADRLSRKE